MRERIDPYIRDIYPIIQDALIAKANGSCSRVPRA